MACKKDRSLFAAHCDLPVKITISDRAGMAVDLPLRHRARESECVGQRWNVLWSMTIVYQTNKNNSLDFFTV